MKIVSSQLISLVALLMSFKYSFSFLKRCSHAPYHQLSRAKHSGRLLSRSDTINSRLEKEVKNSLISIYGLAYADMNLMIGPSKMSDGDYQSTVAMQLAKSLQQSPKDIAGKVVASLSYGGILERAEVSGPGFINLFLSQAFLKERLLTKLRNHQQRVGIDPVPLPERVIVDFSSPNIAKEMHVGHLRSTIIGDSISRILEFLGHDVLRLNHVGDWGTQFGMLIHYMKSLQPSADQASAASALGSISIGNLVEFYQRAKKRFDEDIEFQEASRQEVVKLQAGNRESVEAWRLICEKSRLEFQQIYDLLNVSLIERGESFYNPFLPELVASLIRAGIAVESDGAIVIFLDGYKAADGNLLPLLIRKSDGGYLYATTDLAALKHRITEEKAKRIVYVTDAGQSQHFQMVFEAARKSRILDDKDVEVTHVPFGLVLGEDGKKIKTRSGESVKLRELLIEAIERTKEEFLSRSISESGEDRGRHSEEELARRAKVMGIGAVKYADLSMNRESNYRFSFRKMLSLQGNTAPYMLYAYVRIRGIQRKVVPLLQNGKASSSIGSIDENELDRLIMRSFEQFEISDFLFQEAAEISLAKHLLRSDDILLEVANQLFPNKICDYLFELSQKFNQFYESCPVAKASDAKVIHSRLALCTITANTIRLFLQLLGIQTLEEI